MPPGIEADLSVATQAVPADPLQTAALAVTPTVSTRRGTPENASRRSLIAWLLAPVFLANPPASAQAARKPSQPAGPTAAPAEPIPLAVFADVIGGDESKALAAIARIGDNWRESSAALLIEMVPRIPSRRVLLGCIALIEKVSGRPFDGSVEPWYEWLWSSERPVHPDYAQFKALLYTPIDSRFGEYFSGHPKSIIRLDEIRWGGVHRDGIPPLKNPKMIAAQQATWLNDDDIVFGVAINGDIRAYPKRILAWHEMFKDRIGGRELAGVYCTLCGALVLYDVTVNGVQHELGTSGFLYRSNKLMYDHATKSLWSTFTGTPVVGPLVNQGIELKPLYVVTTTWKEWRRRHPETQVLSLDTGYRRDYDEGAAYREYFATDRLMFGVPTRDDRLPNKAEVLALRRAQAPGEALAVAADFLASHPVYHDRIGGVNIVVLTDPSGANRVYESNDVTFVSWDNVDAVRDSKGVSWKMDESVLTAPTGRSLKRLPAHRAFWFGWHAAFPATRLVK
jgi:hypothetical protein